MTKPSGWKLNEDEAAKLEEIRKEKAKKKIKDHLKIFEQLTAEVANDSVLDVEDFEEKYRNLPQYHCIEVEGNISIPDLLKLLENTFGKKK